jgi:hypothetical protein
MATRRSPLRAFTGRFGVAFLVAVVFMGGAVFAVNYVIDTKLDAVARVKVSVASAPPQGANYLLIGSDTRAFVDNQVEQDAFGDQGKAGGQRSDTMMLEDQRGLQRRPGQDRRDPEDELRDRHQPLPRGRLQELPGDRQRDRERPRLLPVSGEGREDRALHHAARVPPPRR